MSPHVCPVGPLVPSLRLCLDCGAEYTSEAPDAACGCGLSRQACVAALGLRDELTADPIASARADFAGGLFRRGIAIVNQALQDGIESREAWFLKARFLHSLGYNRSAAAMLDGALARVTDVAERIGLLEEQSYLWAECQRGEEALQSADAALAIGSDSIRTHYLRGRALALLGRLEEARIQMNQVLTLEWSNADAQRGLKMIEAALRPERSKRWWQLWRQ
jgi:tetratricopeptide (TPR) repeat protein